MEWFNYYPLVHEICMNLDNQKDMFSFLTSCSSLYKYFDYQLIKCYYDSLIYKIKLQDGETVRIKHFDYSRMKRGKVAVIGDLSESTKDFLVYEKIFPKKDPHVFDTLEYWNFITKEPVVWDHPFSNFADFNKLETVLDKNMKMNLCILDRPSIWFFISRYLSKFDYVFIINFNIEKDYVLFPEKNKILSPLAQLLNSKINYGRSHFLLRSIVLNKSTAAVIDNRNNELYFINIEK